MSILSLSQLSFHVNVLMILQCSRRLKNLSEDVLSCGGCIITDLKYIAIRTILTLCG